MNTTLPNLLNQNLINWYKNTSRRRVRSLVQMKIVLNNNELVNMRPRRLAPKEKHILNEQIKDWLNQEIIRPSRSD